MSTLMVWPHYDTKGVRSMEEVRQLLDGGADDLNWLFLSTSGVHGSYTTLDEMEKSWDLPEDHDDYVGHWITVLIVRPRLVSIRYGSIPLSREDVPWLRQQVDLTLRAVRQSQRGNRP